MSTSIGRSAASSLAGGPDYIPQEALEIEFSHTSAQGRLYMPCAKRITLDLRRDHERCVQLAEASKVGRGRPMFF
jgi:hypothetical protein